jgi:hypothetical protein
MVSTCTQVYELILWAYDEDMDTDILIEIEGDPLWGRPSTTAGPTHLDWTDSPGLG